MKFKYWFMLLGALFLLLGYNMLCYFFVNKIIETDSKWIIDSYFNSICKNCNTQYEYLKTIPNQDGNLDIFIKVKNNDLKKDYYRFVVKDNGSNYTLVNVNKDIPAYIK